MRWQGPCRPQTCLICTQTQGSRPLGACSRGGLPRREAAAWARGSCSALSFPCTLARSSPGVCPRAGACARSGCRSSSFGDLQELVPKWQRQREKRRALGLWSWYWRFPSRIGAGGGEFWQFGPAGASPPAAPAAHRGHRAACGLRPPHGKRWVLGKAKGREARGARGPRGKSSSAPLGWPRGCRCKSWQRSGLLVAFLLPAGPGSISRAGELERTREED